MTLLDIPTEATDFPRDRWGRPLIVPPDGGKPVGHTRYSNASGAIEDRFNLDMWARRGGGYGMATSPGLVARMLALGGHPSTWDNEQRKAANKIMEDALDASKAGQAAEIGTAIHKIILEHWLRGDEIDPGPYRADVEAFMTAITQAGWDIETTEQKMVTDAPRLAGTADMIVKAGRTRHIADLKTGRTVNYATLSHGAQLAAASRGQFYDLDLQQRVKTPRINQNVGYIVHLPAGEGRCEIHELDLNEGWQAVIMNEAVRTIRKDSRKWSRPMAVDVAVLDDTPDEGDDVDISFVKGRYERLDTEARTWIGGLFTDARHANRDFGPKEHHTARRASIMGALVSMGEAATFDAPAASEALREMVAAVLDIEPARWPAVPLGAVLGACNADQAAVLERMAVAWAE